MFDLFLIGLRTPGAAGIKAVSLTVDRERQTCPHSRRKAPVTVSNALFYSLQQESH